MKAGTRTLLFAVCFGAPIVVLACVLIAANGGSDLAKDIAAISVGLAAVEAVWSATVRIRRSLLPMIEKAGWFAFRLELRVRYRIRLRGARVCISLKDASKRPMSVGLLRLLSTGGQDHPVPFHDCAAILPELRNLQELELGWLPWTALPSELSLFRRLRSVVVLNMPIREFPAFLADCSALQELRLRGTDIDKLPDRMSGFDSLRSLDLSNSDIAAIPDWVDRLPKLRELILHDTHVPEREVARLRRSHPGAFVFWSGGRRPARSGLSAQ